MKRLLALACLLALPAHAQDWPAELADGTGIVAGKIRTNWNDEAPKVLWKKNIGKGCSTWAIVDDRAVVTGNDGNKDTVWCLDAKTGKEIWTHSYDEKLAPKLYAGGPNAAPTINDGLVYTISKTGKLFCLDFSTGKVKWQKHLKDDFGGKAPDWGYSGAPLIDGDHLIVLPCSKKQGAMFFLDKKTGKTVWHTENAARSGYTEPVLIDHKGTRAALVFHGRRAVCYDIEKNKGDILFEHEWRTSYDVNASNPQYLDGLVFMASGYGKGYCVVDTRGSKPKVLHKEEDTRLIFQNSLLVDGDIIAVFGDKRIDAELIRMDMKSGKIRWKTDMPGTRGSSLIVGEHLVLLSETGDLIVGTAGKNAWKELGRIKPLKKLCWSYLAYSNGRLFARNNDGQAVVLDVAAR